MGARSDYPVPPCPKCGAGAGSKVGHTYYTVDSKILRTRHCVCGWKWWTSQEPESTVDLTQYKIHIPDLPVPRSRKKLRLIKLNE